VRSEKEAWKEPKPRNAMGELEVEKGSRKGCSKWNIIMSRMEIMGERSNMFLQLPWLLHQFLRGITVDPECWGRVFVVVRMASSNPPAQLHQDCIPCYSLW